MIERPGSRSLGPSRRPSSWRPGGGVCRATTLAALLLLVPLAGGYAGVEYEGAPVFPARELDELLGVVPGATPSVQELRERLPALLTRYVEEGYLDAVLTLTTSGDRHVIRIEPGPRVTVGGRILTGVPEDLADSFEEELLLDRGDAFSARELREDLERSTDLLTDDGYAFAETRAGDFTRTDGEIAFRIAVAPGARVEVDSLHVVGLGVTRPATVERLAGFRPGERFRHSRLGTIRERLVRSGLFARVSDVELRTLPDGAGAYVLSLEEAPSTLITGVLGVGGAEQELTGLLDVTLGNLFGTARAFRALWEGRGAGRVYYELGYREPWVLGLPVALLGEFRQDQEDTLFTRTDWLADVEYAVLDRLTLRVGWQAEESTTPLALETRTTRSSSRFGLRWDGRDDVLNVRRGGLVDVTATQGTQKERLAEGPSVRREVTTLAAVGELHVPLASATGMYAGLEGYVREARGETLRRENLYPLGGVSTIRGYEERRFRTGLGAAVALELRRFLDPVSGARVHLFCDVGYMDPARSLGTGGDAWKLGAGIGLRVPSRVGLLGIDLGASDEVRSFEEARIHLSVVGRY